MEFLGEGLPTTIGSLPHTDVKKAVELILEYTPSIPAWPQLPKRDANEGMIFQFTQNMPGIAQREGKIYFDTNQPSFDDKLIQFYSHYLAASEGYKDTSLEKFALSKEYAAGIYALLEAISSRKIRPVAIKGQLTGPFTLGTSLTDQDKRCAYYDYRLREVIVKSIAMNARWQIRKVSQISPACATADRPVAIFIDEPGMAAFGSSTFVSISEDDFLNDLGQVIDAIHAEGGLAGTHCCGNTDWSILLKTEIDILSFDAYEFFDRLALYPEELNQFFKRGGILSWGIVPSLQPDMLAIETTDSLIAKFEKQVSRLEKIGIDVDLILGQSLITPSCGAGSLTEELAVRALQLTSDVSKTLRKNLI